MKPGQFARPSKVLTSVQPEPTLQASLFLILMRRKSEYVKSPPFPKKGGDLESELNQSKVNPHVSHQKITWKFSILPAIPCKALNALPRERKFKDTRVTVGPLIPEKGRSCVSPIMRTPT
jgi:hypothetical protein